MINIIKDKEEVKSVMNIIQAFADGKTIQAIDPYDDEWCDQTKLNFEALFEGQYRIKPEPKYRPFKDAEECWNEMQKHEPFGWVKVGDWYCTMKEIRPTCAFCHGGGDVFHCEDMVKQITFADGTPFGVKE